MESTKLLSKKKKDGYDRCLVDVYFEKDEVAAKPAILANPATLANPVIAADAEADMSGVVVYVARTHNPQYLGPLR
jgi:hypothetical protein